MFWGNVLGTVEAGLAKAIGEGKTAAEVAAELMRTHSTFVRVRLKDLSAFELLADLKKNGMERSVLFTPQGQAFLAALHAELVRLCGQQ